MIPNIYQVCDIRVDILQRNRHHLWLTKFGSFALFCLVFEPANTFFHMNHSATFGGKKVRDRLWHNKHRQPATIKTYYFEARAYSNHFQCFFNDSRIQYLVFNASMLQCSVTWNDSLILVFKQMLVKAERSYTCFWLHCNAWILNMSKKCFVLQWCNCTTIKLPNVLVLHCVSASNCNASTSGALKKENTEPHSYKGQNKKKLSARCDFCANREHDVFFSNFF